MFKRERYFGNGGGGYILGRRGRFWEGHMYMFEREVYIFWDVYGVNSVRVAYIYFQTLHR